MKSPLLSLTTLLAFVCFSLAGSSQYWIQKGGSATIEEALDIATDGNGNSFTTGYFFSVFSIDSTNLTTNGGSDMFLVKTNNQGDVDWALKGGGTNTDRGNAVACDALGNVYVTGFFNGAATFGSTSLTSSGSQDVFVTKYNSSGVLQWAIAVGGSGADIANGISIDNSGNPIVAGQFAGTSTFGSTTLTSNNNSIDFFVMKVNGSNGSVSWVKQGSGKFEDRALSVSTDNAGNSYITGQFSDTLTVDNTYNNLMMNAIFVLKLNASGAEQWLRIVGGGSYNIAHEITTDASGNSYITGDFQGNLTFYNVPPTALTGIENYKIFIAKYNANGSLDWAIKSASSSLVSSRSIDIDNMGNSYITGYFECDMDDYKAEYGPAIFTSIGQEDIFIAKYNGLGNFEQAQQFGNQSEAKALSVSVNNAQQPVLCGNFKGDLSLPTSSNFLTSNLSNWTDIQCGEDAYCGDLNYFKYHKVNAQGNFDVLITNGFDLSREPYDIFIRSTGPCFRGYPELGVGSQSTPGQGYTNISVCDFSSSYFNSTFSSYFTNGLCSEISPGYDVNFSHQHNSPTSATTYMTLNIGGCFLSIHDTANTSIFASAPGSTTSGGTPGNPIISDTGNINLTDSTIAVCIGDPVSLFGSTDSLNTITWFHDSLFPNGTMSNPLTTLGSGTFTINAANANGCASSSVVNITRYGPIEPFDFFLDLQDSIFICADSGATVSFSIVDSNQSPNPISNCYQQILNNYPHNNFGFTDSLLVVMPDSIPVDMTCLGPGSFWAPSTGMYTILGSITLFNVCDTQVHYFEDSVFVQLYPVPIPDTFNFSIEGPDYICPDDTIQLIATADTTFNWFGPGVLGLTADTIEVTSTGNYSIGFSYTITNSFGCSTNSIGSASHTVGTLPTPSIQLTNDFLCPGDTAIVYITSGGSAGNIIWQGPSGNIYSNTDSIYVTAAGLYYCSAGDSVCQYESNSVEITQYNTPNLTAAGSPILCKNDSVFVSVSSTNPDSILWLPPLSGNSLYQTIDSAGTYQCQVVSCGITSIAEIEIIESTSSVEIIKEGILCTDSFAAISVDSSFIDYDWSHSALNQPYLLIHDSGTIMISVMDTDGCVVSDTANIPLDQIFADIDLFGKRGLCAGDSMQLFAIPGLVDFLWLPGNATTDTLAITEEGTYTLTAVDSFGCRSTSEPIEIITPDTVARIRIEGETSFCEGDSVLITTPTRGKSSFQWIPDIGDSNAVYIKETGTYTLNTIDTFGCLAISQPFSVFAQENTLITPTGIDTLICLGEVVNLQATGNGLIQWSDSSTKQVFDTGAVHTTLRIDSSRTIYLWSLEGYCVSDSSKIYFKVQDCDNIFVPNYFTPNQDGWNDVFKAMLPEHTCFRMTIYNRWGQQVHYSVSINQGWDGTVNQTGVNAPEGSYYYSIEFCRHNGTTGIAQGSLTLMRND